MFTINGKEFLRFTFQDSEGVDNFICLPVDYSGRDIIRALKSSGMIKQNCHYSSFFVDDRRSDHNCLILRHKHGKRGIFPIVLTPVQD